MASTNFPVGSVDVLGDLLVALLQLLVRIEVVEENHLKNVE